MGDLYNRVPGRAPVTPRSAEERHRARRAVAGFALDADDLRRMLDVLDLWPSRDSRNDPSRMVPTWDAIGRNLG